MKEYMDSHNGHDKRLVTYINYICNLYGLRGNIITIVRALCEKYSDECRNKLGFVPCNEQDIREKLWDILTEVMDDEDLKIIIHFCGFVWIK